MGISAKTKEEKAKKVKKLKLITTNEELCKRIPEEFLKYMNYCRSLGFEERPDYKML